MAHYSIYIPGIRGASSENLESVHLGDLQRNLQWDWYDVPDGPDGKGGMIGTVITHRTESNPLLGYNSDVQKWVAVGERPDLGMSAGAFWYGIEPERPPDPWDLQHQRKIVGKNVLLNDGNAWHIPETLQLPLDVGRDQETGELVRMYSKDYMEFSKMAEKYVFVLFESIMNLEILRELRPNIPEEEINTEFVLEDAWDYCCKALSINYRIAEPLVGPEMLHLLDDRRITYVIRATLAFPDILEVIEKKKMSGSHVSMPAGLSTLPGE